MTQTQTATIASGQALSSTLRIEDGFKPTAILLPAAIDGTKFTFQVSLDGSTWQNLFTSYTDAAELYMSIAASAAARVDWFPSWPRYVKIRSGTAGTPTNQTADRAVVVVFEK